MLGTVLYSREFHSDLEEMTTAIHEALEVLASRGWIPEDKPFEAHLCMEEAVVNAIRHGNCSDKNLSVRLEIIENEKTCRIRVHDCGAGFCLGSVAEPDGAKLGGRGICLIKHFTDDVKYLPEEQCLEMIFRRKSHAKGEIRS